MGSVLVNQIPMLSFCMPSTVVMRSLERFFCIGVYTRISYLPRRLYTSRAYSVPTVTYNIYVGSGDQELPAQVINDPRRAFFKHLINVAESK
jgi:hypothetical protein